MQIRPIGRVRRPSVEECILEVDPAYAEGFHGARAGDRLDVLYWMHELKAEDAGKLKVHPRGDRSRPPKGVFGLRSPMRPNPIGVTAVRIERIEGSRVWVSGLDARDGSPIFDIKSAR